MIKITNQANGDERGLRRNLFSFATLPRHNKMKKQIKYILKHTDGMIEENCRLKSSAIYFRKEYYKNFGEWLIIEKVEEDKLLNE